ncbi:MAG: serine/threonine-protein kinase [Gemmataceae bacterium]
MSDPIDDLAAEFTEQLRQGHQPRIEEFMARLPERAEELRAALEAAALLEQHKPRRETPDRLGEYRILREIGRGGMGIVYEADHEALGRRVAVKVLPGLADARARERFRREALAAARLHHTNIVPIFGVGERDGQCYYVMQLIQGQSLDRLARAEPAVPKASAPSVSAPLATLSNDPTVELPASGLASPPTAPPHLLLEPRQVARIGAQVADALAHAHAQGVLHRDIKPSNLLVDDTGTVWVTDFGVAKLAEEGQLTQSGDLVGTLRYMPPERFAGISDPRGDVYSLGVTLYELATGQPAFPDTLPQHLIQLITQQSLPRPRLRNPSLPADLETILLKATAREPAQRYASAAELADDLHRFLADRPVKARRIGPLEQAWRWCKRNPALASALVAVLLLLVSTTAVSLYAAAVQTTALEAEKRQRERAESMASRSLKALNLIFDGLAPSRLMATAPEITEEGIELPPRLAATPESMPLLQKLLTSYEEIARESADYPDLRREAAEAHHRMADLRQRLGRLDEAIAAYQKALELYPDDAVIVRARAYNELGRIYRLRQQDEQANQMHARAIKELLAEPSTQTRPESRFELARAYFMSQSRNLLNLPAIGPPKGPKGPPEPKGPKSPKGPPEPKGPKGLKGFKDATEWKWPGSVLDPVPDSKPLQDAIELLEVLSEEYPTVPEYRHLLACCYRYEPRGESRALKLLRDLVRDFPLVPDYRLDLCETLARSTPRFLPGREIGPPPPLWATSEGLQEALKLSAGLVRDYPNVPEYAAVHARMLDRRSLVSLREGRITQAERESREAHALQSRLVYRYPDIPAYAFWLGLIERSLAECLLWAAQPNEALFLLVSASLRIEQLHTEQRFPGAEPLLVLINQQLADVAAILGEWTLARQAIESNDQRRGQVERPMGPFFGRPGPGGMGGPAGPGGLGGYGLKRR